MLRDASVGPIDRAAMWIRCGAGAPVLEVEQALRSVELTLGSQPPSVLAGTVGAWLEGPYAGRRVERDRLESGVASIEARLPDGTRWNSRGAPRSAAGPAVAALILGGGGRCGTVEAAWLKARPFVACSVEVAIGGGGAELAAFVVLALRLEVLPVELEWIGGEGAVASLRYENGRPDQQAAVERVRTLAFSLGLRRAPAPGRIGGGVGSDREVALGELPALLGSVPAGERLRLCRIARESSVAVGGGWLGDGQSALHPLIERIAEKLRGG